MTLEARRELRMPLGQRIAHMPPERRRRSRDLRCQLLIGAGDGLPEVKAGKIRAPVSLAGVGNLTKMLAKQRKPSFGRSSASDAAMSSQDRTSS